MVKPLLSITFILFSLFSYAQEIFDMPNATGTYLTGINDSGEICGYYTVSSGNTIGFWINKYGDTIILHGPGGSNSYVDVTGISNNDMVVGNYGTAGNSQAAQSFVYLPNAGRNNGGTYLNVTNWGGINTQASGITSDTCISGSYQVGGNDCGAIWCVGGGVPASLRCSNGGTVYPTFLYDLDVSGKAVGFIIQGAQEQAAIYRGLALGWDTFKIGGFLKSRVLGMNDNGWICGNFNNETEGFYAKKLANQPLANLTRIYVIGAVTIYPSHINNNNEVVGFYTDANSVDHGFIIAKYDIGFKPSVNGYAFINTEDGVFPVSYTDNFNYTNDPYLKNGSAFKPDASGGQWPSNAFPDWPDFVKCMVESGFYDRVHGVKKLNLGAYNSWAPSAQQYKFLGNCFGMSNTSLQVFDNINWYLGLFPASVRYSSLPVHSYPLVDTVLTAICQTQFKQWSTVYGAHQSAHQPDALFVTMQGLKQSMRNSRGRPHQVLIMNIRNTGGSHAVVPCRIVPGYQGNGLDTVYIYDSNFPSKDSLYLTVNLKEGTSGRFHYTANGQLVDWGNSQYGNGIWLRGTDTMDLAPQRIRTVLHELPVVARSNQLVYAYFNSHSIVTLIDDIDSFSTISVDSGSSTGLIIPVRNFTGFAGVESPGVFSTSNVTKVNKHTLSGYNNNYLMLSDDSYHLKCDRISGPDTTDDYTFSYGSITYINNGTGSHGIAYTVNAEDSGSEYNYFISGLNVTTGNKIAASTNGINGMMMQNFGPPTSYIIATYFLTPDSIKTFIDTIPIQGNTQHTILPHDTTYSGIYILVDTGMTGHIEDSIFIHQTPNDINKINAPGITAWPVPTANELFMTGPQGLINYTIVDVTGRIVAKGELDFGNGPTQKFNVSRFAPGIYTITGSGTQGKWNYIFVKE